MRATSMCLAPAASLLLLFSSGCSSDEDGETGAESGIGPIFGSEGSDEFGIGADGAGFEGNACVGQTAGAESAPATLQLVVDTSGSMDEDAPGVRGSKWAATRRALLDAIDEMPQQAALGVVFYPDVPDDDDGECFDRDADVAIAPLGVTGSMQRRNVEQAFRTQSPDGATPTHDAYSYSFDVLQTSLESGPRFLVLITDGIPTRSLGCVEEDDDNPDDSVDTVPLIRAAAEARAQGVRTFIVGSPGSEDARGSLSRMAEAGGTALASCSHDGPSYCHFDMTEEQDFAAGLARALGTISGLALTCSYDVPAAPNGATLDPNRVNIVFTPPGAPSELIARSPAGACDTGWQYSDDGSRIVLCGGTCTRVRESEGSLALQFGCATQLR